MGATKNWSDDELKMCLATINVPKNCEKPTKDEVRLFLTFCERTGIDYMSKQAYLINRGGKWRAETSIDGLRCIALKSNKYVGQDGPYWCGPDGIWKDVWVGDGPPFAAKVGVYRCDFDKPTYGVVRLNQFLPTKGLYPDSPWVRMPDIMLAKVAESQALRKAFPLELSGVYSSEEMSQDTAAGVFDEPINQPTQQPENPDSTGRAKQVPAEPDEYVEDDCDYNEHPEEDDNSSLTDEDKSVFLNTYGPGPGGLGIPKELIGAFCKYVTGRAGFSEQTRKTYDILMSDKTYNWANAKIAQDENRKLHGIIANHDKLSEAISDFFSEYKIKIDSMSELRGWMAAVAIEAFSKPNYKNKTK